MLHAEPGRTLAGRRHSRSSAIWPCQKQTSSAATIAGCSDDGWPLQRRLIPSQAPSSLQDTMVCVVAISVLGWFSVLWNAEASLLLPPPPLRLSALHSPVSQPTLASFAFLGNWRNRPSPMFLGWHREKTVGAGVYVQKSQSSRMLAVGPCSRRYFVNPSPRDHFSLLALKMVSTSVGRHGTDSAAGCPKAVIVFACFLATLCAGSITKDSEKRAPSGFPTPDATTPKSDLILLYLDLKTSHQLVVREIK